MDQFVTITIVDKITSQSSQIHIHLTDHIGILNQVFLDENINNYIFNNETLLSSFSFQFYGISEGSVIYKIPTDVPNKPRSLRKAHSATTRLYQTDRALLEPESCKQCFANIFGHVPDQSFMQNVVDEMTDPSLITEKSRLRDIFFNKVEGSTACHRRALRKVNTEHFSSIPRPLSRPNHRMSTIKLSTPAAPITEALPVFWEDPKTASV